ncbi:MAG: redoxin domain-containing protein [Bacteroidetes bacterium]|nr:redoxin domain-containing protein [Bacteroidota bacterium]
MLIADNTCTLFGTAPGRDGNVIGVYMMDDYITGTEIKLAEGIVGDSGKFSLTFELNEISDLTIRVKKVHGSVYGEPGRKVEMIVPDRDYKSQVNPDVDYTIPIQVFIDDSTDMNFLADDFNSHFTEFWKKNYMAFVTKDSTTAIDGFQKQMDEYYKWVKNPYFKPWMDYQFASFEDATFHSQIISDKKYLEGKKIYYHNSSYMEFFNNFFKDYLYKYSVTKQGEGILYAINDMVSYDSLMGAMKRLPYLHNDSLRELVMLKGLFEVYDNPAFSPRNVIAIAQQASTRSRVSEHRRIARDIVALYTKLKPGTAAPHFIALDKKGREINILDTLKGKYVYLYFFQTWNSHSMDELVYMSDLQKKYGRKIMFVSVCLDEDTNTWKQFLKANPKYNWTLLYYDHLQKTKDDYNLFVAPAGFIIDPDGKLYRSPADNPSGDLEYDLYRIANPKAPAFVKPPDR